MKKVFQNSISFKNPVRLYKSSCTYAAVYSILISVHLYKQTKKDSRSTAQLLDLFEITHTATGLKLNPITVVKDVSGLNLISSYPN